MASNDLPPPTVSYNFQGRVAIVTGGANGIGRGVCQAFGRSGAFVFCVDIDDAAAESLRAELGQDKCVYSRCDVSDSAQVKEAVDLCVSTFGRIDYLVNNVGIQSDDGTPAHVLTEELWRKVLDVNLTSYYLFSKHCVERFLAQGCGGVIINVSSIMGLQSMGGVPAYAASKGAILSLTRQLCMDYSEHGIRVVAVNPGTIRTPLVDNLFKKRHGKEDTSEAWAEGGKVYPMGRVGEIAEVANVVLFLASPAASFVTGTYVNVDGGIMAKGGWADTA